MDLEVTWSPEATEDIDAIAEYIARDSELLMAALRTQYRQARRITLILDNYIIHKSAMTACFLRHNPKFKLLFQPVYHPWVNRIELLWKQLHDAITCNHKFTSMDKLMNAVRQFMNQASPFPGGFSSTATA